MRFLQAEQSTQRHWARRLSATRSLSVWLLTFGGALWGSPGCGGDSTREVACITRTDCPLGQICVAGDCVVDVGQPPGRDAGPPFDAGPPLDASSVPDTGPGPMTTDGGPGDCTSSLSCADLGAACGLVHDGCSFLDCGDCKEPSVCGGGGVPHQCGTGTCTPTITCAAVDADCGFVLDGCDGVERCGSCPPGETCGGGGDPWRCGTEVSICPVSSFECQMQGVECGPIMNSCGAVTQCGTCSPGEFCSSNGRCIMGVVPPCVPTTCDQLDAECGFIDNGCDGMVDCGGGASCPPNEICLSNRCVSAVPRF